MRQGPAQRQFKNRSRLTEQVAFQVLLSQVIESWSLELKKEDPPSLPGGQRC